MEVFAVMVKGTEMEPQTVASMMMMMAVKVVDAAWCSTCCCFNL